MKFGILRMILTRFRHHCERRLWVSSSRSLLYHQGGWFRPRLCKNVKTEFAVGKVQQRTVVKRTIVVRK